MTPEECRAQADQLRRQACATKDTKVREQLMLMVSDWEKLADDAKELARGRPEAEPD